MKRQISFHKFFLVGLLSLGCALLFPQVSEGQALNAPGFLNFSNLISTGFDLSWRAPTTDLTITGYDVEYRAEGEGTFSDAGHTGTSTSISLAGLRPSTTYEVRVRAVAGDTVGAWSVPPLVVRTLGGTLGIPAPATPTASNVTSTSMDVSWTAPSTPLTITGYDVEYRLIPEPNFSDAGHTGTSTSISLTGLALSRAYEVRVRAVADSDPALSPDPEPTIGAWSLSLWRATLGISAPTSLTASNVAATSFDVSWTAPSTDLTITGYDVEFRSAGETTFSDAGHTGTSASISLTGLMAATSYEVRVRARSESLESGTIGDWSSSLSQTTSALEADVIPGLSTQEQLLLGRLLTYDTIIFNEVHNGTDDATDWLELRNVSDIDIAMDSWQLSIQTGAATAIIAFPAGASIPAGGVLLITNTEKAIAGVVEPSFVLPQTEFALILRSPTVFGDIAGNYFQAQKERPETAPELTLDTVWERVEATTSGYRAEAWAVSTHRNGLGSPGYHPSPLRGDLNADGVVNILDLVLVASQFGKTGITAADLNADNTVNIQDLVLVANAIGTAAAAPSAKQPTAALVKTWLQLARQNAANNVQTSLPEGFSYARGIQVLEQLAVALVPDTTALLANYPNPFNPETWIPYQLSKAADVTLSIYASDGTVVRTLALGHQDAGMYKDRTRAAYWDGKNDLGESVASGLYFYTLTAGEFTATRKMLILK